MAFEIEHLFEEINLIVDPKEPTRAIGYIDATVTISIVPGGYLIDDVYASNTAEDGFGAVLMTTEHPLHPLFDASIRRQFDGTIRDMIADHLAQAA